MALVQSTRSTCLTGDLASGLLWLAEVIEEHSKTAQSVGKRTVYVSGQYIEIQDWQLSLRAGSRLS